MSSNEGNDPKDGKFVDRDLSRIAGAALDVFDKEPLLPESPLRGLEPDRVILTPHCIGNNLALRQRVRVWPSRGAACLARRAAGARKEPGGRPALAGTVWAEGRGRRAVRSLLLLLRDEHRMAELLVRKLSDFDDAQLIVTFGNTEFGSSGR